MMAIFRRGEDYYIDYYVQGKRKREKIGPSKTLAENVLRKRKLQIAENRFLDIKRQEKIKFEDFANTYFELHSKQHKKSWTRDKSLIKNLISFFGGKYLYEITPMLIEKYKIARRNEVSPATTNREVACLKNMFTKAIEWGKAEENPVKKVKLFRENNCRIRYLEKEEIRKLLKACSKHLRPIVAVALNTGMRKGEILNLKWHDIDFKRGIIYLLDTKNNEKREVPMNELLKKALISVPKHPDSPYVFCNKDGKPYANVRKSFFTALKKSGIVNFKFHDLRHTFASHLVMSGIDLNTVKELLGHKSIEMTLRYSHLSPDHKKRAVDILGRQMDAIWTPRQKKETIQDLLITELIENKTLETMPL
jgi:integrase